MGNKVGVWRMDKGEIRLWCNNSNHAVELEKRLWRLNYDVVKIICETRVPVIEYTNRNSRNYLVGYFEIKRYFGF